MQHRDRILRPSELRLHILVMLLRANTNRATLYAPVSPPHQHFRTPFPGARAGPRGVGDRQGVWGESMPVRRRTIENAAHVSRTTTLPHPAPPYRVFHLHAALPRCSGTHSKHSMDPTVRSSPSRRAVPSPRRARSLRARSATSLRPSSCR